MTQPLLAQTADFLANNAALAIGAIIVVAGLLIFGFRDLIRFSFYRTWAISGVCFDESIRRRVLWITPLAIVGVVIVSQLTRPFDEQDAIRQTIKFSLFATGLVVALVIIILAATNLPKEIENRVIFTVVTKPTTRLEIIVGKVLGFARVSAAILLIMGLFTWGYLHLRQWQLQKSISASLNASGDQAVRSIVARSTLEHYRDFGLLTANTFARPSQLGVYGRAPEGDARYLPENGAAFYRFDLPPERFIAPGQQSLEDGTFVVLLANVGFTQSAQIAPDNEVLRLFGGAAAGLLNTPSRPGASPIPSPTLPQRARLAVQILNADRQPILTAEELLRSPGQRGHPINEKGQVEVPINPEQVLKLANAGPFFVQIAGVTDGVLYRVAESAVPEQSPVFLLVVGAVSGQSTTLYPTPLPGADSIGQYQSREGAFGLQLPGGPNATEIAAYAFRDAEPQLLHEGNAPFEMRVGIERSGEELTVDADDFTTLQMHVVNRGTGQVSEPTSVRAESNRNVYFELPAAALAGGNFDLIISNDTVGHFVGLLPGSVRMVTDDNLFVWNLFKSLLVLWLMSILVVIVGIFCSTFLSWPIAIVLSVVILLGHWGVQQIGDVGNEFGNQVAQEMFPRGAIQAKVVSNTVNALNSSLRVVSSVLPDISRFSATEEIERGVSIPAARLLEAAAVSFGFGIPLIVLAYVFLRNKEVAP